MLAPIYNCGDSKNVKHKTESELSNLVTSMELILSPSINTYLGASGPISSFRAMARVIQ